MRFTVALAALVAATSALPSVLQPQGNHALTTREDFVEDDFEIPAESDGPTKRSASWPEVSPSVMINGHDAHAHASIVLHQPLITNISHLAVGWLTIHFFSPGTG